jgi:uncharacterized protein (TIGR00299 family) protein
LEDNVHIHLDLVGGISGDMFIGSMLDCFPELGGLLPAVLDKAGFAKMVSLSSEAFNDGVLTGTRFKVSAESESDSRKHRHHAEIVSIIENSSLDAQTMATALGIFQLIAEVEAKIHGKAVADVAFHEVGAWDSIADVVCAAWLICHSGVFSWSVSKLPLGRGQVATAHGRLPIPAPATTLLLEGFEFLDDGLEGERITPTGAAILRYLDPARGIPGGCTLRNTGFGFGTKKFPGISNVLRCMVFSMAQNIASGWENDRVLQCEFEVDDQTAEDLAFALTQIRRLEGVLDVIQFPALGKKGRQCTSIRVLADLSIEEVLLELCFNVTNTLGIRRQNIERSILKRSQVVVEIEGAQYRVKIAERPSGLTAKVEMDDLISASDERHDFLLHGKLRQEIERAALQQTRELNLENIHDQSG